MTMGKSYFAIHPYFSDYFIFAKSFVRPGQHTLVQSMTIHLQYKRGP